MIAVGAHNCVSEYMGRIGDGRRNYAFLQTTGIILSAAGNLLFTFKLYA